MKFTRGQWSLESINYRLVERMNVSDENVQTIIKLQAFRRYIYDIIDDIEDVERIIELSEFLTQLEFRLQRLWGFPENEDYHRWWNNPKCDCPKLDNEDYLGRKYKIYSKNCIIHKNKR